MQFFTGANNGTSCAEESETMKKDNTSIVERDNPFFIIIPKYNIQSIFMFSFMLLFMIGSICVLIAYDKEDIPLKIKISFNVIILMGIIYLYLGYKTAFKRIIMNPDGLIFKNFFGKRIYLPYDQIIALSENGISSFKRGITFLPYANKSDIFKRIKPMISCPANKQMIIENAAIADEYNFLSISLMPRFAIIIVFWLIVAGINKMDRVDALPLLFVMIIPLSIYEYTNRKKIRKRFEETNWEDIKENLRKLNGEK